MCDAFGLRPVLSRIQPPVYVSLLVFSLSFFCTRQFSVGVRTPFDNRPCNGGVNQARTCRKSSRSAQPGSVYYLVACALYQELPPPTRVRGRGHARERARGEGHPRQGNRVAVGDRGKIIQAQGNAMQPSASQLKN